MTKKTRDILYSVILITFSIVGIIYADVTINQNVVDYELARPDRYVQIWFGALLILSLLLLIRAIRTNDQSTAPKMIYKSVVFSVVLFIVFVLSMPYLGFTISSFLYLLILTIYYHLKSMDRKPDRDEMIRIVIKAFVFSLVLSIGSALLFKRVLYVRLPDFLI